MKHGGDDSISAARSAARWAGITLDAAQEAALTRFHQWLGDEAIAAGGLGPNERHRLWRRHIGDALSYGVAAGGIPPPTLLDVGSGVGLPGIPLAIAWPETEVTLLDRAERRCRLARRAVRVLGLDNVSVVHGDVHRHTGSYRMITFRASLDPADAVAAAVPLLDPGGIVVVGSSHRGAAPAIPGAETIRLPRGILDSEATLLTMTRPA